MYITYTVYSIADSRLSSHLVNPISTDSEFYVSNEQFPTGGAGGFFWGVGDSVTPNDGLGNENKC